LSRIIWLGKNVPIFGKHGQIIFFAEKSYFLEQIVLKAQVITIIGQ
jgi:hypothetical protein